jgi:hypothetical protein
MQRLSGLEEMELSYFSTFVKIFVEKGDGDGQSGKTEKLLAKRFG